MGSIFVVKYFLENKIFQQENSTLYMVMFLSLGMAVFSLFSRAYFSTDLVVNNLNSLANSMFLISLVFFSTTVFAYLKQTNKVSDSMLSLFSTVAIVLIGLGVYISYFSNLSYLDGLVNENALLIAVLFVFIMTELILAIKIKLFRKHSIYSAVVIPLVAYFSLNGFSLVQLGLLCLFVLFVLDYTALFTEEISIFSIQGLSNFIRKRILLKFVLIFTILIIIALSVTSFSILTVTKQALLKSQSQSYFQIAHNLKSEVDKFLKQSTSDLYFIKKNPKIREKNSLGLSAFFYDMVRNNSALDKLVLFDSSFKIRGKASLNSIDVSESDVSPSFYRDAIKRNMRYKLYVRQLSNTFFISIPIVQHNEYVYSLAGYFNINSLRNLFKQIQAATKVEINVLDKNYYSLLTNTTLKSDDARRSLNLESVNLQEFNSDGVAYVSAIVYDSNRKLVYLTKQSKSMALSGIKKIENKSLFIILLSTVIFLIIGLIVARHVEKPIKSINLGVRKYREGQLDYRILIQNIDEFGDLANTLNDMSTSLDSLIKLRAKSEQLATVSQMAVSLNHEINNPLATIQMSLDVLTQKVKDGKREDLEQIISLSKNQCSRIKDLVSNISNISEPVVEEYVSGTKMIKLDFRVEKD